MHVFIYKYNNKYMHIVRMENIMKKSNLLIIIHRNLVTLNNSVSFCIVNNNHIFISLSQYCYFGD